MHRKLDAQQGVQFIANSVHIESFTFRNPHPDRIEKARLEVYFVLSNLGDDGTVTISPFRHHRQQFMLFDQGENDRLTRWLKTTGDAGEADIYQFDYHDLLRLVTPIANEFMRSGRIDVSLGIPPQEVE